MHGVFILPSLSFRALQEISSTNCGREAFTPPQRCHANCSPFPRYSSTSRLQLRRFPPTPPTREGGKKKKQVNTKLLRCHYDSQNRLSTRLFLDTFSFPACFFLRASQHFRGALLARHGHVHSYLLHHLVPAISSCNLLFTQKPHTFRENVLLSFWISPWSAEK